ncbi:MAG TPA: nicotinate-nicotinamide nucleotide adenylyltransferase [Bryobacteraceae bacterium]|nr:nicotinate-nicotinamide nucleotide adenylyltransferase [Bryobacteraceae bacterium]
MEFLQRAPGTPLVLGIFPGAFNPPTRAHLTLARTVLAKADEILFVLPRVFPHKAYEGADFTQRVRMLEAACIGEPRFSIGASDQGLLIDIARECRQHYGPATRLAFLCGRDAAERIVHWDYGTPGAFAGMLREFELWVASRGGPYEPPGDLQHGIRALPAPDGCEEISASEVRRRICDGRPWEHLVPEAVVPLAREIYGRLPAA